MIYNKVVRNASWIIIVRILQAIIAVIITMITARYLGPADYGLINYASSIVSFVMPIMQLGLNNILVQELIENPDSEGEILGTAIFMSFISSILCIIGVTSIVSVINFGESETILVCILYSIILVFQAIDLIQYWYQAHYLSKYSSIITLIAYAFVSVYKIIILILQKNIYWFAVTQSIDYFIISFLLIYIYKKFGGQKFSISKSTAIKMFAKSKYYIMSNLMVTIFAQTDRIMLKLMINDAATGYYSAAVTCAGMTSFVFSAILDSSRPAIFEARKHNQEKFKTYVCRLYCVIIYVSLIQCLIMTIFAKPIINILYGSQYFSSVSALRLIVWYTTFSYMGAVRNIWMLAEGKQKYLWIINSGGAVGNVILNIIFIPYIDIRGAALASLITQILTSIVIPLFIKDLRENSFMMLDAIRFKI